MSQSKNIDYLEALRGYAVIGVVMIHCLIGMQGVLLYQAWGLGAKGVQLFFMASAFTLFLSYSRRKSERFPLRNFYIRRFFRIAPMFYIAILYYIWQNQLLSPLNPDKISLSNLFSHFIFLHGYHPEWVNKIVPGDWSIAVEFSFYALCPLLFAHIKSIRSALLFYAATLIVGQAVAIGLQQIPMVEKNNQWNNFQYWLITSQLPVFAIGILAYFSQGKPWKTVFGIVALLVASALFLGLSDRIAIQLFGGGIRSILLNNLGTCILFYLAFVLLERLHSSWLSNPVICWLGRISFSVYLTHFAVLHVLKHSGLLPGSGYPTLDYLTKFVVVLSVSSLLSWLTFHSIEEPGRRLGSRLIAKLRWN